LHEVGHGGQSRVLAARDQRLPRTVAVKVLSVGQHDAAQLQRFEQEARAAGSLNHPNILVVHDAGYQDGDPYLVTELLEGETLRDALKNAPFEARRAADLALQVAHGLTAAHEHGIVHRDLKPENLFLTRAGVLKIIDFGIARLPQGPTGEHSFRTSTGAVLGTVSYMSPEQVRGQAVDARSDLFALGSVLHEMLSGAPPFDRATSLDTAHAIVADPPRALPAGVPPDLAGIVKRCLEKDRDHRFGSAAELAEALSTITLRPLAVVRRRVVVIAAAMAISGVAGALIVPMLPFVRRISRPGTNGAGPLDAGPSIAVMPFADLSPGKDQDYFSDGLAEEILDALAHVEGLRVAGRTSSFWFKGKSDDAQSIGQKLRVASILAGSVRKEGSRLRIAAQLINAADGFQLWSQIFDRELTGIFAIQEEISIAVVQALRIKLLEGRTSPPAPHRTTPEAHQKFLIARRLLNGGNLKDFQRAQQGFEDALRLDPRYAPAWVGLASATYYASNLATDADEIEAAQRKAMHAAENGVALGQDLSEAWAVRSYLRGLIAWDWRGAESDMAKALQLSDVNPKAWGRYGLLLASFGRLPEALAAVRKAADLDPLSAEAWDNLAYVAVAAGDFSLARAAAARARESAPDQLYVQRHVAIADLLEHRPGSALAQFEKLDGYFRLQGIAMAQHDLGHAAESRRALDELTTKYVHVAALEIGETHAWFGEPDLAFEWLETAYAAHDGGLGYLKCDPLLRGIRADPRYAALVQKMRFPE